MVRDHFGKLVILALVLNFGLIVWQINPKVHKMEESALELRPEYVNYINEVRGVLSRPMADELQLSHGRISYQMCDKIEELGLTFLASRRANIEEARGLHQYVTARFLEEINRHEKLRPFLGEMPFTNKHVFVRIDFLEKDMGSKLGVASVFNVSELGKDEDSNKLFYSMIDVVEGGQPVCIFEESQEEAAQLTGNIPVEAFVVHKSTPLERIFDELLPYFAKKVEDEYRLSYRDIAARGPNSIEEVAMSFFSRGEITQDEARRMIIGVTEQLLDVLSNDERLRPYFQTDRFPLEKIKLRISWRKDKDYHHTYNAAVEGGAISYYQKDGYNSLIGRKNILKQAYKEALEPD